MDFRSGTHNPSGWRVGFCRWSTLLRSWSTYNENSRLAQTSIWGLCGWSHRPYVETSSISGWRQSDKLFPLHHEDLRWRVDCHLGDSRSRDISCKCCFAIRLSEDVVFSLYYTRHSHRQLQTTFLTPYVPDILSDSSEPEARGPSTLGKAQYRWPFWPEDSSDSHMDGVGERAESVIHILGHKIYQPFIPPRSHSV